MADIPESRHIYLYAVIPQTEEKSLGMTGLFDSDVRAIAEEGVSAVVSEIPETSKLRPERKHLAAHQEVLKRLTENGGAVLPVAFGTIAENEWEVHEMLAKYRETFLSQLEKVSGKVEVELRVAYEVPNVFEYFVQKHSDLKEERDKLYNRNGEPTREQKIELGRAFEQIANEDRENFTTQVEQRLSPPCIEIKRNKPRNEKEVMRLSCLLDKESFDKIEPAIEEASKLFDDNFVFEYNGPVPPYNFVDVRVRV